MAEDLASWSDIPLEIVEQIVALCDNCTLLALAQTNHQLNYLAIQTLLFREGSSGDYPGGLCFESDGSPNTVIPAFNLALSVFRAPDFIYYFHPSPALFREAQSITRFLGCISIDNSLTFSFDNIDQRRGFNGFWRMEAEKAKVWRMVFIQLLEKALEGGCRHLTLYGGLNFQIFNPRKRRASSSVLASVGRSPGFPDSSPFAFPRPRPHPLRVSNFRPTMRSLYQGFVKWFKDHLRLPKANISRTNTSSSFCSRHSPPFSLCSPSSTSTDSLRVPEPVEGSRNIGTEDPPPRLAMSPPALIRLDLQSAMMLHSLFFRNTVDLIQANSGSLRHLVLDYIKTPTSTWKKLFQNISLPLLENFTFKLYGQTVGEENLPGIVLEFLTRHPTIRELELEGMNPSAQYPEFDSTGLLPILESLEATPRTLSWLLQNPLAYPKLERISHTYDYCLPGSKNGLYAIFDIGIVPLSELIPCTTTSTRPVNVKFKFSTESGFVTFFLIRGFSFIAPTPSQVFRSVENMTIFGYRNRRFVENFKELLPALEMFPNLRRVEFGEVGDPEELRRMDLVDTIRGSCPLIEEVEVRGSVLDVDWPSYRLLLLCPCNTSVKLVLYVLSWFHIVSWCTRIIA